MPQKKILIVDDEPTVLEVIKKRLTSRHYDVIVASNGFSCLEQAKRLKPDLILLDLLMPAMNGHETCLKLKADPDTKNIPVVIFTSDVRPGVESTCMEEGAVTVVFKPDFYELWEVMEQSLKGRKFDPYHGPTGMWTDD